MLAAIPVVAFFKRTFWLTKRRFSLAGGWSGHARLPRISPAASVHPSCVSQETNVLNTAHLLMWHHLQSYTYMLQQFRRQTLAIQIHITIEICKVIFDTYASWTLLRLWVPAITDNPFTSFIAGALVLGKQSWVWWFPDCQLLTGWQHTHLGLSRPHNTRIHAD